MRSVFALGISLTIAFLSAGRAKSEEIDWNFDRRLVKVEKKVDDHEARLQALEGKKVAKNDPLRGLTHEELKKIDPWYRCECGNKGTNCRDGNCSLNGGSGYCACTGSTYTQPQVTYYQPAQVIYTQPTQYYVQPAPVVAGPRFFPATQGVVRSSTPTTTATAVGATSTYRLVGTGTATRTAAPAAMYGITSGCAGGNCPLR